MTSSRGQQHLLKPTLSLKKEPIGTGGFRQAFEATSQTKGFNTKKWVIKKYLTKTVEDIQFLNQTVESHTKKIVQMYNLARNLAARLQQEFAEAGNSDKFGTLLNYNKVFFGKCGYEIVTVEEFIGGKFDKHINNTGNICGDTESDVCQKAECLVHYTFEKSDKQLMLLDIQGCNYTLFDPEVATTESVSDGEYLFCAGNLSSAAIETFINSHICNEFCKLLGLPNMSQ